MNAFKRLCLLIFGLAGLAALAAFALPWFGPWTAWARSMLLVPWYYITLEVCACIAALGLLICLLRAIFTPANRKTVVVSRLDGDQITVATSAIAAQAAHIVESRGDLTAERVTVRARKNSVDVYVRIRPTHAMNLAVEGAVLHEALMGGLSELAGESVRSVELEFVEADSLDAPPVYTGRETSMAPSHGGAPAATVSSAPSEGAVAADAYEITVPMGHGAGADDAADAAVANESAAEAEMAYEPKAEAAFVEEPAFEPENEPALEPALEPEPEPSPEPMAEPENESDEAPTAAPEDGSDVPADTAAEEA